MDTRFAFLDAGDRALLVDILRRRAPCLLDYIEARADLHPSDVQNVMNTLCEEFVSHLDEDWEPLPYGLRVSTVMTRFNAAHLEGRL